MKEIINSLLDAKNRMKPTAIVAATVKGKGVSFMENNPSFHGAAPNENKYAEAMEELSRRVYRSQVRQETVMGMHYSIKPRMTGLSY